MTIEYKIFTGIAADLQKLVQILLEDGWELQGGAFNTNATKLIPDEDCDGITHAFCNCQKITIFGQAMTKDTITKNSKK